MRLVAGLGNPGERYRRTRHNAGFLAVDVLATRTQAEPRVEGDAWLAEVTLAGQPTLLVKPLAYMNRSGEPLVRLLARTGAAPGDLVVLVDDVALELGTIRIRERGSDGGHNGLFSIGEALATTDFTRVRIGVREVGLPFEELPVDLADYVLAEFEETAGPTVAAAVTTAADAVECLLLEGVASAMNRFNGRRTLATEGPEV